jgi:hypothetical protein
MRPLTVRTKVLMAAEILLLYLRAQWLMRREHDARRLVERMRTVRRTTPLRAGEDEHAFARRAGKAVARTVSLLPMDNRCLARSLVLAGYLERRGISTRLVIGARSEPEFLAHAWIEHGEEPVLPPGDESCGRLVEL